MIRDIVLQLSQMALVGAPLQLPCSSGATP
jgi:hypothetical protein